MAVSLFRIIAATALTSILNMKIMASSSPTCKVYDGEHYYKTMSGYERCRKTDCPPFEKGNHPNCFCCNGEQTEPVNGGWSAWSSWSQCFYHTQYSVRTCSHPSPLRNGLLCKQSDHGNRSMEEIWVRQCENSGMFVAMGTIVFYCALVVSLIIVIIVLCFIIKRKKSTMHDYALQVQNELKPCDTTDVVMN